MSQEDSSAGSPLRRSAGVVIVRRGRDGTWRFLMLRAYRNWDFPKGLIEAGEVPLDAARREVAEETGLRDLRFAWGEAYAETVRYAGNKIARYYLAEAATGDVMLPLEPVLGRPEHHEWRWLTLEEARGLAAARLQSILRWADRMIGSGGQDRTA